MFSLKSKQYLLIFSATALLFIINNILLGSVIPRLPGGSAFGITTMFTVTLLSLIIKRFGCIPMVYFIYSLPGIPSHLLANDRYYLVLVLLLIVAAALFDWYLTNKDYILISYYIAFPLFMILTGAMNSIFVYFFRGGSPTITFDIKTTSISILLGYMGITLAHMLLKNKLLKKLG